MNFYCEKSKYWINKKTNIIPVKIKTFFFNLNKYKRIIEIFYVNLRKFGFGLGDWFQFSDNFFNSKKYPLGI